MSIVVFNFGIQRWNYIKIKLMSFQYELRLPQTN